MCGEQLVASQANSRLLGSSPRVRGTAPPAQRERGFMGIIPACAGNRDKRWHCEGANRDHPRVCGEQGSSSTARIRLTGSSPRVRGTGMLYLLLESKCGIIPACAGNRNLVLTKVFSNGDHPRVCGEQQWSQALGA